MTRIYILLIAIILLPAFALAHHSDEATVVTNSVSVSASSGGNSAEAGEVIEGESSADVFVETTVNGEVVESIDEHYEDLDDVIEKNTVHEGDDFLVETHIEVGGGSIEIEGATATTSTATSVGTIEVVDENVERGIMTEEDRREKAEASVSAATMESSFITFFSQIFSYVFNLFIK